MGRKLLSILATHWGFIVSVIVVIGPMFIRFQKGEIQQDDYLQYAAALPDRLKGLSDFDTRLFPGLPFLILFAKNFAGSYVTAGYLVVFSAFFASYLLLYKLTGSKYSFFPLIFPPAMLNQASIISTDLLAIFFILLGIYLFKKQLYKWMVLIFGLSVWIRPLGAISFAGILFYLFWKKKLSLIFPYLTYFIVPIFLLGAYNIFVFGPTGILHPYVVYSQAGHIVLGFVQLAKDIPRAFQWNQYRIFISGISYLALFLLILIYTIRHFLNNKEENAVIFFIIWTISVFLLFLGFTPYLENFGRYLSPLFPLIWIFLYKKFENPLLTYLLLLLSIGVVLY